RHLPCCAEWALSSGRTTTLSTNSPRRGWPRHRERRLGSCVGRWLPVLIQRRHLLAMGMAIAAAPLKLARPAERTDAGPKVEAFDEVWRTVRDHFYDPHLHGLDWTAVRARYLPPAAVAVSDDALAAVINAMLSELRASHTYYYISNDPAYYQIAD